MITMKALARRPLVLGSGIIVVAFVIAIAGVFSPYIATRVAPGLTFRILGPSALQSGGKATIQWDTSTAVQKKYPTEKIEFCTEKNSNHCTLLATSVPNKGKAIVLVPVLPTQKGYLRLTARNTSGALVSRLSSFAPVRVSKGAQKAHTPNIIENSNGAGGGGNGGGTIPPTPTATPTSNSPAVTLIAPQKGSTIPKGQYIPVQVQLQWTSNDPYTCQTWLLDGKPIPQNSWVNNTLPFADGSNYPAC